MSALEQALALWHRGFSLIPVPRPRPGVPKNSPGDGKTPVIAWKRYQTECASEAQIRAWFAHDNQNIGILTGAVSNLVVVDFDSPAARRWCVRHLPYTPWQTKTARGFHLFYRHPGVPIRNKATLDTRVGKIAVDVRGDGGFVIGPSSLHASGYIYYEAGDWTRADVPRFWPGWLTNPTTAGTAPAPVVPHRRPTGDVVDRARRYLAAIPRPEIGRGSDAATLYAACRLVRGFGLSDTDAVTLLWDWTGGRPGWTRDWVTEKVAHAVKYGTEDVGALR